jgi:hypothetical protein
VKRFRIFVLLVAYLCRPAIAQDATDAVRVKTILHQDGTRTVSRTDPSTGEAEETTYDGAGKTLRRIVFRLNAEGKPENGTVYDRNGKPVLVISRRFDIEGRVSEQTESAPTGAVKRRLVFAYDSQGRIVRVDTYDADGNLIEPEKKSSGKKPRRR